MPVDRDEARGDEWFSTIYVDFSLHGGTIHLAGGPEGLRIYVDDDVEAMSENKVHELVLALGRYERWLKLSRG